MEGFDHVDVLYQISQFMKRKGLKSYETSVLDLENAIIEEMNEKLDYEKECVIYRSLD